MTDTAGSRALVLGGGGVAGIAWETGLLAGLADAGADVLADAELIVGTSAGATVAAQVTAGVPLKDLLAAQRNAGEDHEPRLDLDFAQLTEDLTAAMTSSDDPLEARRRVGELALASDRVPETERRKIIEARLPRHEWPAGGPLVRLTGVDAATGELAVFDRDTGVSLVDAVAASCAVPVVWPAVTVEGRRYMDGGVRSPTNTDVALGYARVLVLRPLSTLPEPADVRPLGDQSELLVVDPDARSLQAIGENPLDPAVRPACAAAGYAQGMRMARRIGSFWRDGG